VSFGCLFLSGSRPHPYRAGPKGNRTPLITHLNPVKTVLNQKTPLPDIVLTKRILNLITPSRIRLILEKVR